MSLLPDLKELKKLAEACRKAGIKHFRLGDLEFTLSDSDSLPKRRRSTAKGKLDAATDAEAAADGLSEEELLFWSVAGVPPEKGEKVES